MLTILALFLLLCTCTTDKPSEITFIRPSRNTNMVATHDIYVDFTVTTTIPHAKIHFYLYRSNWYGKKIQVLDFGSFDAVSGQMYMKTPDLQTSFNYFINAVLEADGKEVARTSTFSPNFSIFSLSDAKKQGFPAKEADPYPLFGSGASTAATGCLFLTILTAFLLF